MSEPEFDRDRLRALLMELRDLSQPRPYGRMDRLVDAWGYLTGRLPLSPIHRRYRLPLGLQLDITGDPSDVAAMEAAIDRHMGPGTAATWREEGHHGSDVPLDEPPLSLPPIPRPTADALFRRFQAAASKAHRLRKAAERGDRVDPDAWRRAFEECDRLKDAYNRALEREQHAGGAAARRKDGG